MSPEPASSQSRLPRRRVLQAGASVAVAMGGAPLVIASAAPDASPKASPDASPAVQDHAAIIRSGDAVPALQACEDVLAAAMANWDIAGGQLAIAKAGKLVYSRGFGLASVEDNQPVERTSRFRIASCSKPFTGVGILKLVDEGSLALDTPVFPLLALQGPANAPYDPRLDAITVQDLLVHAGGWDSAGTGMDPQYLPWPALASHVLGEADPASAETIVRYMLSQPLDFDPGTKSSYSNFGFNVLGRVIEHVSGQPFEVWTEQNILAPAGITSMAIGGTTLAERMPDEVRYYAMPDQGNRASVYPNDGFVPQAYGSYYIRAMDAHGGYIATCDDLVRFMFAIDGTRGPALLSPEMVTAMESTPRPEQIGHGAGNASTSFGLAWDAPAVEGGHEWVHAGALEGSSVAWTYRSPQGVVIAWVVNAIPTDYGTFFTDVIPPMKDAIAEIAAWPDTDLFV
ncbi:MAG: serine hydrolase domain-containing protein [Thermomicrobiales bacterium]